MELQHQDGGQFVFRLERHEASVFRHVLSLYPLVPLPHHALTRPEGAADPRLDLGLLHASIQARREENRRQLASILDPQGLKAGPQGRLLLTVRRDQLEQLLQVLNDVRVGSWLTLGCPDPDENKPPNLRGANIRYFLAMELCGHFEWVILEALQAGA